MIHLSLTTHYLSLLTILMVLLVTSVESRNRKSPCEYIHREGVLAIGETRWQIQMITRNYTFVSGDKDWLNSESQHLHYLHEKGIEYQWKARKFWEEYYYFGGSDKFMKMRSSISSGFFHQLGGSTILELNGPERAFRYIDTFTSPTEFNQTFLEAVPRSDSAHQYVWFSKFNDPNLWAIRSDARQTLISYWTPRDGARFKLKEGYVCEDNRKLYIVDSNSCDWDVDWTNKSTGMIMNGWMYMFDKAEVTIFAESLLTDWLNQRNSSRIYENINIPLREFISCDNPWGQLPVSSRSMATTRPPIVMKIPERREPYHVVHPQRHCAQSNGSKPREWKRKETEKPKKDPQLLILLIILLLTTLICCICMIVYYIVARRKNQQRDLQNSRNLQNLKNPKNPQKNPQKNSQKNLKNPKIRPKDSLTSLDYKTCLNNTPKWGSDE